MDDLLELTGRAEATHFWFRGFRKFVAPVIADLRPGAEIFARRLWLRHRPQPAAPASARPAVGFDLHDGWARRAHAQRDSGAARRRHADSVGIGAFDVATSFDVLQCVEADVAAVREMARIVRPGGVVVLTVAALDALRGDHAEVWQEVRRYTPAAARRLVETAGFRPCACRSCSRRCFRSWSRSA